MIGVFVTGTDTGVGKTVAAACLACAWRAGYWKPVQTGMATGDDDTATVVALAGVPAEHVYAPAYALQAPLSPHAAAELEGVSITMIAVSNRPNRTASQNSKGLSTRTLTGALSPAGRRHSRAAPT